MGKYGLRLGAKGKKYDGGCLNVKRILVSIKKNTSHKTIFFSNEGKKNS